MKRTDVSRTFRMLVALGAISTLLTSCIHFEHMQNYSSGSNIQKPGPFAKLRAKIFPPKKKPRPALVPLWFGTISLVDMQNGYVLIDSNALYAAVPGKELRSLSKNRETARLRISGEKNPPFFIADIISGTPQVGDRVYAPDHP